MLAVRQHLRLCVQAAEETDCICRGGLGGVGCVGAVTWAMANQQSMLRVMHHGALGLTALQLPSQIALVSNKCC